MGLELLFLTYFALFSCLYAFQWKDKKYVWLGGCCAIGMLLITVQKRLENKDAERFRVYNTKQELTIGYFKGGRGIIYSTFDSLQARGLQYACGREIQLLKKFSLWLCMARSVKTILLRSPWVKSLFCAMP